MAKNNTTNSTVSAEKINAVTILAAVAEVKKYANTTQRYTKIEVGSIVHFRKWLKKNKVDTEISLTAVDMLYGVVVRENDFLPEDHLHLLRYDGKRYIIKMTL